MKIAHNCFQGQKSKQGFKIELKLRDVCASGRNNSDALSLEKLKFWKMGLQGQGILTCIVADFYCLATKIQDYCLIKEQEPFTT